MDVFDGDFDVLKRSWGRFGCLRQAGGRCGTIFAAWRGVCGVTAQARLLCLACHKVVAGVYNGRFSPYWRVLADWRANAEAYCNIMSDLIVL